MKPSILISGTIASTTTALVTVSRENLPATLFAKGLAGAEAVAVSLVSSDVDLAAVAAGDILALKTGGTAWALDVDTPQMVLTGPGIYQLSIASSAGAVSIGIY